MLEHSLTTADEADRLLRDRGWVIIPGLLAPEAMPDLRRAVLDSVEECGRRQVESGATLAPDGTAHHTIGQYPAFDAFLESRCLDERIAKYFGGAPYILHAFNPVIVKPSSESYLHRIHRDVRTFGGDFRFMINMLVMVDPFTLENGATHVLSASHRDPAPPDPSHFWSASDRLTGPAGSVVLFDSNLWHAAGCNRSPTVRTALTASFSRAFVKQQMDYPRFLGKRYGQSLSPHMKQILGYNAMVPVSYGEFYCRAEDRRYKSDQG